MSDITISFDDVDFDKLIIESDFTDQANRMLPKLIEEFGKATAVNNWKHREKSGASNSERGRFIRDAIRNYEMDPMKKDRVRKIVIEQLKEQKYRHDKK